MMFHVNHSPDHLSRLRFSAFLLDAEQALNKPSSGQNVGRSDSEPAIVARD
jgi:hypothetical protein